MRWKIKMIVHKPNITQEENEICVSAKVEIKNNHVKLPGALWFKFPKDYKEYITDRSDGFAAALFPLAMALGEDLEVKGTVSPRLAFGMREYQSIASVWWPNRLRSVNVKFENLKGLEENKATGKVGCGFSGGIDSFYTLWSHLPQNEEIERYRISHCLMIKRFSFPDDEIKFDPIQKIYEPMMKRLNLQLIVCDSNIVIEFIRPMEKTGGELFNHIYGSILSAFVLIMGRFFSDFYIASAYKTSHAHPAGSNPWLVHLISTEATEIILDGALTRFEKTVTLSKWPETYFKLRVCFRAKADEKKDAIINCCKCGKCVRTMTTLSLFKKLHSYASFPSPLTGKSIRKMYYTGPGYYFAPEIIDYANRTGRKDIAFNVRVAVLLNKMINPIYDLNNKLVKQSKTYSTLIDLVKKILSIRR